MKDFDKFFSRLCSWDSNFCFTVKKKYKATT